MVFNEPWHNGVNLCTTVQESHAALPGNSYPGHVLDPIPLAKGIGIQEESLFGILHLGCPTLGHLQCGCLSLRGVGSLLWCHPLFSVEIWVCSRGHHQWTIVHKVVQAATVVTTLLLLSILHCPGKVHNELFSYTFDAICIFAINAFLLVGTLFLQVCYLYRRGLSWLTAFKLP